MAWGKKPKKPSTWGKKTKTTKTTATAATMLKELRKLKKAKATKKLTTVSPNLLRKLEKVREAAPPHPKTALYAWLTSACHMRRTLGDTEADLLALAKTMGFEDGDPSIRAIIKETAAKHMTKKVKERYVSILEQALQADVHSTKLAKFIDDAGGINNCAKRPRSQWATKPSKVKWPKPKGPKA